MKPFAWVTSIVIHLVGTIFTLGTHLLSNKQYKTEIVITEKPASKEIKKPIKAKKIKAIKPFAFAKAKPAKKLAKPVFGMHNKTLTSDQGLAIKAGNTIAKDLDDDRLDSKDAEPLPNPTDDFLVNQMPKLKKYFTIPYPKSAQDSGIEGPVVIELLIDQKGYVRDTTLVKGLDEELDKIALTNIRKFEFEPALMDNKPVAVKLLFTYRFKLER